MKYILPFLLLLCFRSYSQSRQLLYKLYNNSVTITDSKEDSEGNLVHVGYTGSVYSGTAAIFKTDAQGNILWSRTGNPSDLRVFVKVCLAANGDYIALAGGSFGSVLRIDKNGNTRWFRYVGYSNTFNEAFNSITELPNGNIAICGTNDFYVDNSSDVRFQGYLILADSAGNFFDLKIFGRKPTADINDQYYFNDLVAYGDHIYIAGAYNKKWTNLTSRGLLLTTDLAGNLEHVGLMSDVLSTGNQPLNNLHFSTIGMRSGRLVLGGAGMMNGTGQTVPFVALTDTATGPASLKCILQGPGTLSPSRFAIRDTGDVCYVAMQPVPSTYEQDAFVTRLYNGTVRTRKYYQDSAYRINSIALGGTNNIILSGFYASGQSGYLAIHDDALPSSRLCHVSDTVFQVYTATGSFAPPDAAPPISSRPMVIVNQQLSESCIYDWYLCGDTVCREDFAAHITVLNDTALCEGDTVRLASTDCYPKIWLRKGDAGEGTAGPYFESTTSGHFRLAITNGACFDTAGIQATIYPKPSPRITQQGDSLVCDVAPARAYQWYDADGNPMPGATGRYFHPAEPGAYRVEVTVGLDCSGFSEVYLDIDRPEARKAGLQLFPNPASGLITVFNPSSGGQQLSFYKPDGRLAGSFALKRGRNLFDVKQSGLSAGTYIAVLVTPEGLYRQKFVVLY